MPRRTSASRPEREAALLTRPDPRANGIRIPAGRPNNKRACSLLQSAHHKIENADHSDFIALLLLGENDLSGAGGGCLAFRHDHESLPCHERTVWTWQRRAIWN